VISKFVVLEAGQGREGVENSIYYCEYLLKLLREAEQEDISLTSDKWEGQMERPLMKKPAGGTVGDLSLIKRVRELQVTSASVEEFLV